MYVDPSVELYTLSDLSRLWVLADVYEADVPYVRVGTTARLTVEGVQAAHEAKVTFLAPTVDEATRTLKVRFELDNKGEEAPAGRFVNVRRWTRISHGLAVPESAVIPEQVCARSCLSSREPAEHLEPREVKIGPSVAEFYPVESGLRVGESAWRPAQFLPRLRAAFARPAAAEAPTVATEGEGGFAGPHRAHHRSVRAKAVLCLCRGLTLGGLWCAQRSSPRYPILRHAGDHRDGVDGPQPHADRESGHPSAHDDTSGTEGQDGARLHDVRHVVRVRHLPGR